MRCAGVSFSVSAYIVVNSLRAVSSLLTLLLAWALFEYYNLDFQFLQLNRVYLLESKCWHLTHVSRGLLHTLTHFTYVGLVGCCLARSVGSRWSCWCA